MDIPLLPSEVVRGDVSRNSRVVDEHVYRSEFGFRRFDQSREIVLGRNVRLDRNRLLAGLTDP
jgi:hypothetical protein